jgi:uncharacterized GH25 family protein
MFIVLGLLLTVGLGIAVLGLFPFVEVEEEGVPVPVGEIVPQGNEGIPPAESKGMEDPIPRGEPKEGAGESSGDGGGVEKTERPVEPGMGKGRPTLQALLLGEVVDGEGLPVAGARVMLVDEVSLPYFPKIDFLTAFRIMANREKTKAETVSDAKGRFRFHAGGIKERDYGLRVTAEGYATAVRHEVRVGGSAEPEGIRVVLGSAVALFGRVVDGSDAGIEGATVVAFVMSEAMRPGRLILDKYWTQSGPEGRFRMGDLPAGTYSVVVRKGSLPIVMRKGTEVTADREITVVMGDPFTLLGKVIDGITEKGVEGARIRLSPVGETGGLGGAVTDSKGEFRVKDLPPGEYEILIEAQGYPIAVRRIESLRSGTMRGEFRLNRDAFIQGRVLEAGSERPIEGAWVVAYAPLGALNASEEGDLVKLRTRTDANGAFTLSGLPPGVQGFWEHAKRDPQRTLEVTVVAIKPGWSLAGEEEGLTVQASPQRCPIQDVVLPMVRSPRLSARVVDSGGKPVAGAEITIRLRSSLVARMADELGIKPEKVVADENGTFSVLVRAAYRVQVVTYHPDFALHIMEFKDWKAGQSLPEQVIELQRGGEVIVKIVREGEEPLAGVKIEYNFCGRKRWDGTNYPKALSGRQEARSDEQGSARFDRLTPGIWQFKIEVDEPRAPYMPRITVGEGEVKTIRFLVCAPRTIEGIVVDEKGAPLEGVSVGARLPDGWGRWGRSGKDGAFKIEKLPKAEFALTADLEGYKSSRVEGIFAEAVGIRIVMQKK